MKHIVTILVAFGWFLQASVAEVPQRTVEEHIISQTAQVYFAFNSYDVTEDMHQQVAEFAHQFSDAPGAIRIVGYADPVGASFYNMILSQRRAKAVKNLLESYGFDAARVYIQPKGEHPKALQAEGNEKMPQSRRVDLIYMPSGMM